MSKQCPYCKSKKVGSFNDNVAVCTDCHRVFGKSQLVDTTLFDQVTQSPETLAENSIYVHVVDNGDGEKEYFFATPWTDELYETIEAATAAAVVKLKEVVK